MFAETETKFANAETVLAETEIKSTGTEIKSTGMETVYAKTEIETQITEKSVFDSGPQAGMYDMPPDFYAKLYEIIGKYPHFGYYDISVAYRDIETGFRIMLDPDVHYYSASVIKAPYMLYIYRLALAGKADLERTVTYTEKYFREGTGELKNMEFGTEFTLEELIGYTLESSDNAAFAMLKDLFPEEGYTKFAASLGAGKVNTVHDLDAKTRNSPKICCESALAFSEAIYDFIREGNPYSERLWGHMTSSRNPMIYGGSGAEVVRKYGWYEGFFHDMAIVCGEKTYLLTIITNLDCLEIGAREYGIFRDISLLFAEYSDKVTKTANGGDTVIIKIPKQEVKDMVLPNDPYMLLSVVNMKLRDVYKDFDALCEDMDEDRGAITETLAKLGYVYDRGLNAFVVPEPPAPEE